MSDSLAISNYFNDALSVSAGGGCKTAAFGERRVWLARLAVCQAASEITGRVYRHWG